MLYDLDCMWAVQEVKVNNFDARLFGFVIVPKSTSTDRNQYIKCRIGYAMRARVLNQLRPNECSKRMHVVGLLPFCSIEMFLQ